MNTILDRFDNDEREIQKGFSNIEVDTESLKSRVKEQLREEAHKYERKPQKMRIRKSIPLVAAMVTILALSTTVFAALGGFDRFIERVNPTFAELLEPVMAYSEDQGIRMTVLGAQSFDNMAVVYVSLQDVTGENRLTETTSFFANLALDGGNQRADSSTFTQSGEGEGEMMATFGGGSSTEALYFDEATNTLYFELRFFMGSVIPDTLNISASQLTLNQINFSESPIDISLGDLPVAETITVSSDYTSSSHWDPNYTPETRTLLLPDNFAALPYYPESHRISNIGIIDGQLRVQELARDTGFFGAIGVAFALICPNGETIHPTEILWAFADENYTLLHTMTAFPIDGSRPPYSISESIFDVDVDNLENYTLIFWGGILEGVEGSWQVNAYTTDTASRIIALTPNITVSGHNIEFMTLSPLGLEARGNVPEWLSNPMEAYLETADGLISLGIATGAYSNIFESRYDTTPTDTRFQLNWMATTAIDIDAVTAIILDGERISLP